MSLSLSTGNNPPYCQMLAVNPVLCFSSCNLSRDPQGTFQSNKPVDRSLPCEHTGNFISMYPRISKDPEQSRRMVGKNVILCLLALLYQWVRCFDRLKSSRSCLVFPLSIVHKNFINTGQDSMFLGLEHCSIFSWTDTESSSQRLPIVSGPGSPQHPGPICIPDETFDCRGSPRSSDPLFCSHPEPLQ